MKLVDILAREMKAWPEDEHFAWQDSNKEIRFSPQIKDDFYVRDLAEDHVRQLFEPNPRTGVTRSQWQSAVDALKAGEQVWDGEGLPPVGTICTLSGPTPKLTPIHPEWAGTEVKIYAHFATDRGIPLAAYVSEDHLKGGVGIADLFVPIRTAEQIAEQEHREAVEALAAATDWILTREACEAVLAAGYRKQDAQQ